MVLRLPVARVPAEFLKAQPGTEQAKTVEAFKKMVRGVRRDENEGLVLPAAFDRDTNRDGSDKIVSWPITVPCPLLLITPNSFDFGLVNVAGSSGAAAFNVVNMGALAAPISAITISTGDFVMENNGCNGIALAPNASCAVTVHFAPGSAGPKAAT